MTCQGKTRKLFSVCYWSPPGCSYSALFILCLALSYKLHARLILSNAMNWDLQKAPRVATNLLARIQQWHPDFLFPTWFLRQLLLRRRILVPYTLYSLLVIATATPLLLPYPPFLEHLGYLCLSRPRHPKRSQRTHVSDETRRGASGEDGLRYLSLVTLMRVAFVLPCLRFSDFCTARIIEH